VTRVGCEDCLNAGYKSRQTVMELWSVSNVIRKLIDRKSDENQIHQQACEAESKHNGKVFLSTT
jgi:type II secretory ATPase GspE/PulE/Tfp pilus assembly ATPase PilB-like protein